eukprot:comp24304_c0_seq1/m.60095 comp24304_c0_seq1/g.60095  ORF comp24304_c0_seq1/g.60095 comp24304_c0_seq1/m.60095 type:complete len:114 (+) comp24304_c0_seq1:75-416(+)
MDKEILRQIHIKSGILSRSIKDLLFYESEKISQEKRIENTQKNPEKDQFDVNKQIEVLNETIAMLPGTREKIGAASQDLHNYLVENDGKYDRNAEQVKKALENIESAKKYINQ